MAADIRRPICFFCQGRALESLVLKGALLCSMLGDDDRHHVMGP